MERTQPLVSICMPAYNAENYIAEALRSVIAQSYANWEIIVVNDGSTDNTADELVKFEDDRIRIYHQPNKGQCAAANEAYRQSAGELIKFMDADDIISENFLKEQVAKLNRQSNAVVSASWGRFYRDDLGTFRLSPDALKGNVRPIDWLVDMIGRQSMMMQCALWLIPRDLIDLTGGWDERLSLINDFEFFTRLLLQAEVILAAPKAVLYYRSGNHSSLSGLKTEKGALSAYHAIAAATSYMLDHEPSLRVRIASANCFQSLIYTFYPLFPDLISSAEHKIKLLGTPSIDFPAGGYTKLIQDVVGWKLTIKLKRFLKLIT